MYVPFNRPRQPNVPQFNQYGQPFGQQGGPPYTQPIGPQYHNNFGQYPQNSPYGQSPIYANQAQFGEPPISRRDIDDIVDRAVRAAEAKLGNKSNQDMVEMPIPILDGNGDVLLDDEGKPWFKTSKVPAHLVPMFMNMQSRPGNPGQMQLSIAFIDIETTGLNRI